MRIKVNKDRIFVILEPLIKEKVIKDKFGNDIVMAIPETHHERSRIGVVQQVGEEVTRYVPGDKVLLSTYAGVRIHLINREIDGQTIEEDRFRIIREEEVLAILYD